MSGLLRSAGRLVRRSIPQAQGSFRRSPVRLLSSSGGAARFQSNQHSRSKQICRATENQKARDEFASDLRVVRDKLDVLAQTYREADEWDNRREKVLVCASLLFIAFCVFA